MSKRIIFHIIAGIIGAIIYYMFFDGTTLVQAFLFILVYVGFSLLFDFVIEKRRAKLDQATATVDHEKVKAFIEAVGGAKNISSTDHESSRLNIVINEVDLIDKEKLKALALDGAYLSGDQLQVTIGANSSDFSRQIKEAIE